MLLSKSAIVTLQKVVARLNKPRPQPLLRMKNISDPPRHGAWLGKVIGINLTTLGGSRKLLSVQRIKVYPFLSEGTLQLVDGGIDSQIVCGCEVLVFPVQRIVGWPEYIIGGTAPPPPYFAIPIISVDQRNIDEPDPLITVMIIEPSLPLLPNTPCVPPPPP